MNPLKDIDMLYEDINSITFVEAQWCNMVDENGNQSTPLLTLFIKSHILFLHILLVCTSYCFALFFILLHILLFISFFTYIYIYALVWCYFYIIFYSLHCPLSGPDLIYISLLIIPCIIYYVTNKETLNLEPYNLSSSLSIIYNC